MNVAMNTDLADLYRKMVLIRSFEETLLRLFSLGHLRGTVHTCLGQEACAVGVVGALDPARDTVCSNHRGHGHFLAFHDDMKGILAEVLGLESGICGGKGGSQHLHVGNFYSNGILGGMVPVAAGMALAQKRAGERGISVVFAGDGAMSEGVIYEALNMAALWKLPLLLVIEHNQIAQSTPWTLEHGSPIEDRPASFGVPTETVDGNNVRMVRNLAEKTVADMRDDPGPRCLLLQTYRLGPHSKGDDNRNPAEIADHRTKDPLIRAEAELAADVVAKIQAQCKMQIKTLLNHFSLPE
ncbi:MAG TPA: thiamine pyrophosphate-dependent dehydrogenase E1 component subunit alpha [Burkholderiaceae bacterium]|nr:thiamine pyrophosphate-dependent dehydrogenase E1 component subunit alpha [Burkholderiaceae bacterium]